MIYFTCDTSTAHDSSLLKYEKLLHIILMQYYTA